jgi:hypothetical protein
MNEVERNDRKETNMNLKAGVRLAIFTAGVLTIASLAGSAECTATAGIIGDDACCFTNPRFSGVCKVTPGPDETCSEILAYLNNQSSVGKTYCGNTKVRGGWTQVGCDDQTVATAPKPGSSDQP